MQAPSANQLVLAHQASTAVVRQKVLSYGSAVWDSSPGYRDADVLRIIERVSPVAQSGQAQVARLTDAYVGRMAVMSGVSYAGGVNRAEIVGYRGVSTAEVYTRAAVALYTALSDGYDYTQAVKAGSNRFSEIIRTDLQQAQNRQASASIARSGFNYFRRQLTGRENCAICVIASTQRYTRGELLPIHPGCDCSCVPLMSASDPGQVIDSGLLEMTHEAIGRKVGASERSARDLGLGKVSSAGQPLSDFTELIVTNNHGELGPTLAWRFDHFTGADDLHSH